MVFRKILKKNKKWWNRGSIVGGLLNEKFYPHANRVKVIKPLLSSKTLIT